MIGSGQDPEVSTTGVAGLVPTGLFVVERRLPKADDHQLTVLQAALSRAASRFSDRGDGVRLLGSIFIARQERLLSLFTADTLEAVRAVNEASLVPFASIEPAVELPGLDGLPLLLPLARAAYAGLRGEGRTGPGASSVEPSGRADQFRRPSAGTA